MQPEGVQLRWTLLSLLLLSVHTCNAQVKVNPLTQITWPHISGIGAPSSGCLASNYGQPYTDISSGTLYICAVSGWVTLTGSTNAITIQGNAVQSGTPSNGQSYFWSTSAAQFQLTTFLNLNGGSLLGSLTGPNVAGVTTPENFGAYGDNVHYDTTAIQACWGYSGAHSVVCQMDPVSGTYLVNGQLSIVSLMNVQGIGSPNGTIIRSEFNGDAVVIPSAPVQGVTIKNVELKLDPSLPNSRGFHIQGVAGGPNSNGGLWSSHFINVEVDNPAFECLWLDGGTGASYTYNLPNQFLDFQNFSCNGPPQSHPSALIRASGQTAQVQFIGGQTNGDACGSGPTFTCATDYPNALIEMNPVYANQGPGLVTFRGYTVQSGNICIDANESSGVHFENGWLESCGSGLTAQFTGNLTFTGNHMGNVGWGTGGSGFKFLNGVSGEVSNNDFGYSSPFSPHAFGLCTNQNTVILHNNHLPTGFGTSACGTVQLATATTLNILGPTTLLNGDNGVTPVQTLSAPAEAGESFNLYASGASVTLACGGNINFAQFLCPVAMPAGTTATFRTMDLGSTYTLESLNGGQIAGFGSKLGASQTGSNLDYTIPAMHATNSGSTSGIPTGSECSIHYKWSGSGSLYFESAFCETGGALAVYRSGPTNLGSESFVQQGLQVGGTAPTGTCVNGTYFVSTTGLTAANSFYYCDPATLTWLQWPYLTYAGLTVTTAGNGGAATYTPSTGTLNIPTPTSSFPQHTYYLSTSGNDSNAGGFATPWLTPNHALNCGDVVIALPGTYTASNFASGKWGAVTCPSSNGVAWLQCQTFDTCKISSGSGGSGILVSASYWGVQGWEVSNSGNGGPCFGATPPTPSANIHHIVFANNVANGCGAGAFSFYNHGAASVDYIAVVGSIAYNAAQNSTNCYSGFSVFQPVPTDTIIGTHIYFAWDYAFGNIDHNPCAGTTPTDGNGFIFDSFDGANPGGGTGTIYTQQAVMENNISVDNGGRAWEFQTYTAGTSVTHGTTIIQNNTGWGNQLDPNANYVICTDGSLNIGYGVLISKNIDMTTAATACTGHTLTGINIWDSSAGTTAVVGNLVYTTSGTNIQVSNGDGNTGPGVTGNTTGTNPTFAAAANPAAPSCSGKLNVTDCMSGVIANFTASASASLGLGYQPASNANGADSYFPQWLCRAGLPAGIVTKSCQ